MIFTSDIWWALFLVGLFSGDRLFEISKVCKVGGVRKSQKGHLNTNINL